jgi:hypothetical protein
MSNMASNPAKQIGFKTPCPTDSKIITSVKQSSGGASLV